MTLHEVKKLTAHICRLLKVTEITYPIGRTNKGNLGLKFAANSNDFEIMLDAVPLSTKDLLDDENNIEMKKMIEKYWLEQEPTHFMADMSLKPTVHLLSTKKRAGHGKKVNA